MKKIISRLFTVARVAFILGDGIIEKMKIFFVGLLSQVQRALGLPPAFFISVNLKAFGKSFPFYFTGGTDIVLFDEIFFQKTYECTLGSEPRVIFDLGSNTGVSVIFFRLKYPEASIYAFEPDPSVCSILKKNVGRFYDVRVFPFAIAGKDEKRTFFIYPKRSSSSSLVERMAGQPSVEVEAKTISTLFREFALERVDLLKFDIEGGEFEVFGAPGALENVVFALGELHLDLIPGTKEQFLAFFKGFDVEEMPVTDKRIIMQVSRRKPPSLEQS